MNRIWTPLAIATTLALTILHPAASRGQEDSLIQRGREIYADSCADCHGQHGEGVSGAYEPALLGDDTVGQLSLRIHETMPEGDAESCIDEDAEAVAAYIHQAFYSEAAQLRNRPPKIGLARLTAEQLRQSYADLYAGMANGNMGQTDQAGLQAVYFNWVHWKEEEKKLDTTVPTVDFDFGREAPAEGLSAEKFFICFKGGLYVPESGRYELIVQSSCSFTMDFGRDGRRIIDNHVQSGDKTDFHFVTELTGGRTYPVKINFVQRERKTESPPAWIHLKWVTPGGVEEVIPEAYLVPTWVPPTFALQTALPPDDRSYGFERGIDVNRQWDQSTTSAALEFADIVVEELWPAYNRKQKEPADQREKLNQFLTELVTMAFRGNLSPEQKAVYIDRQLDNVEDDAEAIRRCLLISLKSPYFLYPDIGEMQVGEGGRVASQLALVLFDSLPVDKRLQELAQQAPIDEAKLKQIVWASVNDGRVQGKLMRFMHYWLDLHAGKELAKSAEVFPGFDAALAYELKQSLNAFLADILTSDAADYRRLFLDHQAFGSQTLADFYGPAWMAAPENESTETGFYRTVADNEQRFGVLTHPYLTSALAYHDGTSPIHRGVFLIRFMLGRNLKPPQAAFSPLSPDLHPDLTTRQRVEKQTSPQECQACHVKINGLGFTLENFDAVGRYRADDNGKAVDSTGEYVDRSGNRVEFKGAGELAEYLANSPDAHRAFVNRMFQYFVKQPPAAYGPETLEQLTGKFRDSGFNIKSLLVEIAVVAALQPGPETVAAQAPKSLTAQ